MKYNIKYRLITTGDSLRDFSKKNLFRILVFSSFVIFGFIVGISIGIKAEDASPSIMAMNWLMGSYAVNNMNLFLYFALKFIVFALIILLFISVSQNIYLSFVYYLTLFFIGLSLGGPIIILFRLFGLSAIFIAIIGFFIFEIIYASIFVLFASSMLCIAVEKHKYGCIVDMKKLMKDMYQILILAGALILFQTIVLFICSVFIL